MKCIQYENPALHESDFCATGEDKSQMELMGISTFQQ